jgi:hypothetical protein
MKKLTRTISIVIASTALLVWCIPILIGQARAKPFEGSFLCGNCACNHEIFYLIEGGMAYDYCPGHNDKKLIGTVVTNNNHLTVLRITDGSPDIELKMQDGTYYLHYPSIKDHDWEPIEQINNPWRTSFRSYLPE